MTVIPRMPWEHAPPFPQRGPEGPMGQFFDVKKRFGAKGDGITDDTAAIEEGIAAMDALGGGTLFFPPGTYLTTGLSYTTDNVSLVGAGELAATIKLIGNESTHVINLAGNGNAISHLTVNGNRDELPPGGGHGIRAWGEDLYIGFVRVEKTRTYGIALSQGETQFIRRVLVDHVTLSEIGRDGFDTKDHTGTNDQLYMSNITVESYSMLGEHGEAAIDLRGPWQVHNVFVEGVGEDDAGVRFREGDEGGTGFGCVGASLVQFKILCDPTATNAMGVVLAKGMTCSDGFIDGQEAALTGFVGATSCTITNVIVINCDNAAGGIGFWQPVNHSKTSFVNCSATNCKKGFFIAGETAKLVGCTAEECSQFGLDPTGSTELEVTGQQYVSNTADLNFTDIAAANEITLPSFVDVIAVSGNTEIKKIKASRNRRRVTLSFTGSPKIVDGENLKLAGNFEPAGAGVLTLVCNSVGNWLEEGRSKN